MSVENTGTNQFENVSGSVEGENELAQQLNQTVPQVNGNVTTAGNNTATEENNAASPAASPAAENTAAPQAPPVTTSGYVMSAKAKDLQTRRKALFAEMQQEYAKVFGDDKKAPKAKMYHAAGLLTIKERDGDEAYMAKLQEYIDANRGKYTNKTRKVSPSAAPAAAAAAANSPGTASPIVRSPESAAESGRTIIRTIETMASKVKEMVDTMVSTTKTLVKSDNPDMAAIAQRVVRFANESATGVTAKKPRKSRSNKGSTHKRRAKAEAVNE